MRLLKNIAWFVRHPVFATHWMVYGQPYPYKA